MKKYFYSLLAMLTAVFALSSCEDVPSPYDLPIFGGGSGSGSGIEAEGDGTVDNPFNVEGVIAFIEAGENLDQKVYIKGYVTSVKECSPSFGNATFYIASEAGGTNTFYVYRCMGLNGKSIESEDQIKEGYEVVVYGKVTDYNGTKETVQKEAYIYSINGQGGTGGTTTGEAKGTGTQADPYNPTGANNFISTLADNAKSEGAVYIKGKISKVKECSAQYGNASFYITETGSTDEEDFYVYRCLGLGNKAIDSDTYVKVGDEVIICGKVTKYVSEYGTTPETVQKEAYIYSLNGKVEAGTSGDQPEVTPGTPSGDGTAASPFNVAAAVKKCQEVGETATTEQYYVKGLIKTVSTSGVENYGNITIDMVDAEGSNEVFKAFQINSINGEKFTSATAATLKTGDVIVVKGNLVNYKGNTPETTGKGAGCLVSVNGKTELSGGGNTGGNTGGGTALTSLVNGGFEEWENNVPVGWKSASTASSANLTPNRDAHGGQYAAAVEGKEASNVRLATSEMTLPAGTYTFSFYAKPAGNAGTKCQCRPGFVPVTDGKVGSYSYGDYATLTYGDWTLVSYTFTLDAEKTICLVVMNPKASSYHDTQSILIDDASLTK